MAIKIWIPSHGSKVLITKLEVKKMSRIEKKFAELKAVGRTALIPYMTAGDPEPNMMVDIMHMLVENGADMIELGVPFSDPMADGPTIQKAVERALRHGVSLRQVLQMVEKFRATDADTPLLFMGYLNPVEAMGAVEFASLAKKAGLDGVLLVDLPPEEAKDYNQELKNNKLDQVFLVSPTTPESRLKAVEDMGAGFTYYVSLKGVTGKGEVDVESVKTQVATLKNHVNRPVGIGFGIRDAQSAYAMAQIGDGVIVGSALVSIIEQNLGKSKQELLAALAVKVQELRNAIDLADKGESL